MRALVVGCGYLGRRIAERWCAAGHEVTALTRSSANAESLKDAGVTPVLGDVTSAASLTSLPTVDLVLYAVGYDRSSGDRRAVVVGGLQNVFRNLRGKAAHVVFISTTSVYGQQNGEWVDVTSPAEPDSEAGRMALAAEKLVRTADMANSAILRLTGLYGPDRLLRRVEQMRAGEPLAGNGDAWLNLIHVDDAATAVTRAAERLRTYSLPSPSGEGPGVRGQTTPSLIYLVTDDRPVRRREYYKHLAKLTDSPPPVFDEAAPTRVAGLGKRCRNDAATHQLELTLAFPTFIEGLPDAWRRSAASL